MNEPNANDDEPWKEALGEYFQPFLQFFFPQVYSLIDCGRISAIVRENNSPRSRKLKEKYPYLVLHFINSERNMSC
ncbi:hypothetical protein NUACC26_002810 [Scytonema sp. NUACC26]